MTEAPAGAAETDVPVLPRARHLLWLVSASLSASRDATAESETADAPRALT